jgi:phosphoribulokinase
MSARHPVIAITGSSGAGTTTVTTTFQHIFRREGVKAVSYPSSTSNGTSLLLGSLR